MDLKIALAQINTTVGDLDGNAHKIVEFIKKAREKGADLVVFPELAVTGYPPKDLLLKQSFVRKNRAVLDGIVKETKGIAAVVGFVDGADGKLFNAAALASDGKITGVAHKTFLPNYDVFDEKRYFTKAGEAAVFEIKGIKVGINVCEDIWADDGPAKEQAKKGTKLIVNISASPFHVGKIKEREALLSRRGREHNMAFVYVNLVGGQDDLVFDGGSLVYSEKGKLLAGAGRFKESLAIVDLSEIRELEREPLERLDEIYHALVLGIGDYVRKNGFGRVVIGLSGGIDSALTAALAARALGPKNVLGVFMPSTITSKESAQDAKALAENLEIDYKVIPIAPAVDAYKKMLKDEFKGTKEDITEENIQARIRGNVLMALSNKFGYLVLSTGNKSETAVGYATLYGDMAGGLAAISDVPKTTVFELADYIKVIPRNIIIKEPSAELRVGQKDTDTLPPYDILDPIIHAYIEENKSIEEIVHDGNDEKTVRSVVRMIDKNEYKRQQAAPGIRITPKALGFGRRMPITNKYDG